MSEECPAYPTGSGVKRCPPDICDCFIDMYPDDPAGLHPEAFVVGTADQIRAQEEGA